MAASSCKGLAAAKGHFEKLVMVGRERLVIAECRLCVEVQKLGLWVGRELVAVVLRFGSEWV